MPYPANLVSSHPPKSNIYLLAIILAVLFVLGVGSFPSVKAQAEEPPVNGLFEDVADANMILQLSHESPTITRQKFVKIDYSKLSGPTAGVRGEDIPVFLNLFEDVNLTAHFKSISKTFNGELILSGALEGSELSSVIFVIKQDVLIGNIRIHDKLYEVRYTGQDLIHAIYEIDQGAFPGDGEPISVNYLDDQTSTQEVSPLAEDGSRIDVMVVYTQNARLSAGGTTAMVNLINLAVQEANQSYSNSAVIQRLNLVHSEEVIYISSGDMSLDLVRLQNPSDGYMDNVPQLRDAFKADIVTLIVEESSDYYCGYGYIMTSVSHNFAPYAFNVVRIDCATGSYVYAHELGHNMGANHDWYVNNSTRPYEYSHGYVYVPGHWITVMAYYNECSDYGVYCTRIPYWSNPSINYAGARTGVPQGEYHPANNALVLNNTAYVVSNFRVGCETPPTPELISPANGSLIDEETLLLDWNATSYASEYEIQLDDNTDFSSTISDSITLETDFTPPALPGAIYYWRVRGHNTNSGCDIYGSWSNTWNFTVPSTDTTFIDVPRNHPLYDYIESLYAAGYTAGCNIDPLMYCPGTIMNRAESAVFMLRGAFGAGYTPNPTPSGILKDDWSPGYWAEKWAEAMYTEGLSAGCSTNPLKYCPWIQLNRQEASVFGLRMKYGMEYVPPAATGTVFADMTDPAFWATKWTEQAYADGLLPECGWAGDKPMFCPNDLVNRGWGAYLVVTAKGLLGE